MIKIELHVRLTMIQLMVSVYVKNDILNDENENCVSCQNE